MKRSITIRFSDGHTAYTSRSRAESFVRRGRAKWTGQASIELTNAPTHEPKRTLRRSGEHGYDREAHTGVANPAWLKAYPMAGDVMRLFNVGTAQQQPRGKSGPVRLVYSVNSANTSAVQLPRL